ncbi:pectinesterase 3 [Olea europaea subsp. europaea]|uniref:Pectinesterase 3 n=1 Tax=Olea europaea subsp. europaea TaxID=158383 RepID=A0A8S0U240_OLEEU|nr:pectinesterase 3 [Olea europaea subsp. europaea]
MESHDHYRFLFIVLFFYIIPHTHAYRNVIDMTLSPNMAPNLQPMSSPSLESAPSTNSPNLQPMSSSSLASAPSTNSPNLQPVSSPSPKSVPTINPPLNYVSFPPLGFIGPSSAIEASAPDPSSSFIPKNIDPRVKKICESTDHPSLCLGTVAPLLDGKFDSFSILKVSIKACSELTKIALSMAKKFSNMPGVPPQVASIVRDCNDSYDEAMSNFEKALNALPERDMGTVNVMLSAVITDIGDCEDALFSTGSNFPISDYAEKLTNMTSNCLAIASLMQD